jgi:hypothetical protein
MCKGPAARLLALAMCFLATNALGQAGKAPASAKATLLLASDVACTVKLDGEKVADLQPDAPAKLEVAPGEYLVSAATPDGLKWSKAVQVKAPKTVVKIDFTGAPAAAPAAKPAPSSATGTLLVFADSPIDLQIDGKASGSMSGDEGGASRHRRRRLRRREEAVGRGPAARGGCEAASRRGGPPEGGTGTSSG